VGGLEGGEGVGARRGAWAGVGAIADMAPSDCVNLRFPADWADAAVEPVSRMLALASADSGDISLFSPRPTYAATDADAPVMVEATPKPAPPAAPAATVALAHAPAKPP